MSTGPQPGRFGDTEVTPIRVAQEQEGADPLIGRTLEGRFEIRERLGEGGMGTVYRAYQSSIDREVAIKVVRSEDSVNPIAVKRFMREARMASQISHPSLVVIHDFGHTHDGLLFLVMELVEGRTLQEELREGKSEGMELERFLRIGMQLCGALSAAHHKGIIHRDIKPSNIVLAESGSQSIAKVLDFGLARSTSANDIRITKSKQQVGTPLYMAPEMIRAEALDARSDIYQLGCTLYEMAEGKPPFAAKTVEMLFVMHLEEAPPPLLREGLGTLQPILMSMLAKEPSGRPSSIDEVHALFEKRLTEHLTPASPSKPPRRGVLLGGAAIALVAAAALFFVLSRDAEPTKAIVAPEPSATVFTEPSATEVAAAPDPVDAALPDLVDTAVPDLADPTISREMLLTSSPDSEILQDGQVIGKTPMRYHLDPVQPTTLEFRAVGYEPRTLVVDGDSAAALDVILKKVARARRSRPRRKPAGEKPPVPKPVFRLRQ